MCFCVVYRTSDCCCRSHYATNCVRRRRRVRWSLFVNSERGWKELPACWSYRHRRFESETMSEGSFLPPRKFPTKKRNKQNDERLSWELRVSDFPKPSCYNSASIFHRGKAKGAVECCGKSIHSIIGESDGRNCADDRHWSFRRRQCAKVECWCEWA